MKKNTASQVIGVQMVSATDGSAFTSTVSCLVTGDGGTQGAGGGTVTHEGNGFHTYTPTQAETNYNHIAFTFTGTGAVPKTVQVYTTFPQTGDTYAALPTNFGDLAITATTGLVDVNDKTGYSISGTLTTLDALDTAQDAQHSTTQSAISGLNDPTAAAIADAVWDEALSGHLGAGSTGEALNAAGAAGDPWTTALPGAYGAGSAGYIIGNNIDAPLSTIDTVVDGIQTDLSNGTDGLGAIKTAVDAIPTSNPTAAAIADAVWDEATAGHVTAGTYGVAATDILADTNELQTDDVPGLIAALNDPTAAAIADAVLDEALSGHVTAGTLGKAVADIEADTNELQSDDIPTTLATLATAAALATVDTVVDGIQADLDNATDGLGAIKTQTAAIEADTQDIQSRLPAALVSGRMSSDAVALSGSTTAADNLEASALAIISGAAAGTPTTTVIESNLTGYTNDQLIGRVVIFTSGNAEGEATDITDYVETSGVLTVTALSTAPAASDTFIIV